MSKRAAAPGPGSSSHPGADPERNTSVPERYAPATGSVGYECTDLFGPSMVAPANAVEQVLLRWEILGKRSDRVLDTPSRLVRRVDITELSSEGRNDSVQCVDATGFREDTLHLVHCKSAYGFVMDDGCRERERIDPCGQSCTGRNDRCKMGVQS